MTNQLIVRKYLKESISFKMINGEVYANATEMSKAFPKKNLSTWINSKGTEEYIDALCSENKQNKDFYISIKSGSPENGGGTWVHEVLLLDLARWLNVKFRIWCDEQIADIIRNANVPRLPKTFKEALLELVKAEEEKEILQLENSKLAKKNKTQNKIIDTMTSDYDGTLIRVICHDYINAKSRERNIHQSELYGKVYTLVGRTLKMDLEYQYKKFVNSEREKVAENTKYNYDNGLKGLDRKSPFKLKDSKANISKIEYVCDVLEQGNVMLDSMAKVLEVGIEDIISKYNLIKTQPEDDDKND